MIQQKSAWRRQERDEPAKVTPLFPENLAAIRQQVALWDETYGPGKVACWLFDIAFHRLYRANGFKFASKLLTETRYALKRSEGSSRRRKRPQQHSSTEVASEH